MTSVLTTRQERTVDPGWVGERVVRGGGGVGAHKAHHPRVWDSDAYDSASCRSKETKDRETLIPKGKESLMYLFRHISINNA